MYEGLFFKNTHKKKLRQKLSFLRHFNIPKLSEDESKLCEEDLTENNLYDSLKSMQNDKSPGNDGLTKEFYETFWNELKEIFVDSVLETKEERHLRTCLKDRLSLS